MAVCCEISKNSLGMDANVNELHLTHGKKM